MATDPSRGDPHEQEIRSCIRQAKSFYEDSQMSRRIHFASLASEPVKLSEEQRRQKDKDIKANLTYVSNCCGVESLFFISIMVDVARYTENGALLEDKTVQKDEASDLASDAAEIKRIQDKLEIFKTQELKPGDMNKALHDLCGLAKKGYGLVTSKLPQLEKCIQVVGHDVASFSFTEGVVHGCACEEIVKGTPDRLTDVNVRHFIRLSDEDTEDFARTAEGPEAKDSKRRNEGLTPSTVATHYFRCHQEDRTCGACGKPVWSCRVILDRLPRFLIVELGDLKKPGTDELNCNFTYRVLDRGGQEVAEAPTRGMILANRSHFQGMSVTYPGNGRYKLIVKDSMLGKKCYKMPASLEQLGRDNVLRKTGCTIHQTIRTE